MTGKTVFDIRRENLRKIMAEWGGPTSLAKKLGHSNGSALSQVIGPHPRRMIGERQARDIERTLSLPVGWLDESQHPGRDVVKDEILSRVVAACATVVQDAGAQIKPAAFAELVALVYADTQAHGTIRESFVKQLLRLTQ